MSLGSLVNESQLYIAWQNVLSANNNFVSAMQNFNDQVAYLQSLSDYNSYVSQNEIDYMNNINSMISNFLAALPSQPS